MEISQRYAGRIAESRRRIENVYLHRADGVVPFQVSDVNYWLSGETPGLIPAGYFTDPAVMLDFLLGKIRRHMETFDDDYIPFLLPWFGTPVLASAFGTQVLFQERMDPVAQGTVITEPEQVKRLTLPDPTRDGLMPRVLAAIRHFRAHTNLPINFTDPQGPLTTALTLVGPERLFLWFYLHPDAVHELMDLCTEAFIQWVQVQKREIGEQTGRDCFPHSILLPERFGRVWLCDDDCGVISPQHYREFVVPYNARIFKAFGGGTLHFCGSAEHQLENFLATEGLVGINNFCMGNFRQIYKMQELFAGRLVVMACDFTPVHIAAYYDKLFRNLRRRGTIVASSVSPELALNGGKYEMISRDGRQMAAQVYEQLRRHAGAIAIKAVN